MRLFMKRETETDEKENAVDKLRLTISKWSASTDTLHELTRQAHALVDSYTEVPT